MLNTRDLENRWLKYKIKSYIPHFIIALSSIVIIVIVSIFMTFDEETKTPTVVEKKDNLYTIQQVTTKIPEEPKEVLVRATNEVVVPQKVMSKNDLANNNNSLKLSPSLDFIQNMQHTSLPYYQDESTVQEKKIVKKEPEQEIVEEIQDLVVEEATVVPEKEEVKKVTINRRNVADDIKHIINRFKKNNNPALSLFVAKKYYELGDYHKAYNYALITNQINRDIESSWIVFAKSLVKLNEKEMAIKTLKEYIENSHSSSAQILLDEITSGKFK